MGGILLDQAVILSGGPGEYITLNTLFGAVVVLAVIVLIMLITYFTNIKPNLGSNASGAAADQNPVQTVFDHIDRSEAEELINDGELVAVITAAIYASMGDSVPADGFVVRSIRKTNSKRWMNA